MNVDMFGRPAPLKFGSGESEFQLLIKRFTGQERAAVIDAIETASYAAVMDAVGRLVIGWVNVKQPDGMPINFELTDDNGKASGRNRFNEFMGAIPLVTQMRVIAALMGACGLPVKTIDAAISMLTGEAIDSDPTAPPQTSTQTAVSGG